MVANSSKSSLSPREVHRRLVGALKELERAQRNAVLWFGEIVRRKIYRELGYSSIYQYAELELGFKKAKTAQFLRLCESFRELPDLRRSVARGELSWTKAREVAKVATAETEGKWIAEAKAAPRRVLETRVAETRRRARVEGSARGQVVLEMGGEDRESHTGSGAGGNTVDGAADVVPAGGLDRGETSSAPVDLHVRMTAEQYARYHALMESLARKGERDKAEVLLAGLEQLALEKEASGTAPSTKASARDAAGSGDVDGGQTEDHHEKFTRVNSKSPYQVVVHQCPTCEAGTVATPRGEQPLSPRELRTILCDSYRRAPGGKNQAAIPPRLRRAVLERDRYRCQSAGCGHTRFLAVHHLAPRETGGRNTLENLITLCSGCHRALHRRE